MVPGASSLSCSIGAKIIRVFCSVVHLLPESYAEKVKWYTQQVCVVVGTTLRARSIKAFDSLVIYRGSATFLSAWPR